MSVLFPTYTPVQGGLPNKRNNRFCMGVLTLTIRPKPKHTKLCVHPRLRSLTLALTRIWAPVRSLMSGHNLLTETLDTKRQSHMVRARHDRHCGDLAAAQRADRVMRHGVYDSG